MRVFSGRSDLFEFLGSLRRVVSLIELKLALPALNEAFLDYVEARRVTHPNHEKAREKAIRAANSLQGKLFAADILKDVGLPGAVTKSKNGRDVQQPPFYPNTTGNVDGVLYTDVIRLVNRKLRREVQALLGRAGGMRTKNPRVRRERPMMSRWLGKNAAPRHDH